MRRGGRIVELAYTGRAPSSGEWSALRDYAPIGLFQLNSFQYKLRADEFKCERGAPGGARSMPRAAGRGAG